MGTYNLEQFLEDCRSQIADCTNPANCVSKLAPLMFRLLQGPQDFLKPEHYKTTEDGYCRNGIHVEDNLGLFALTWKKGQWTPIHDHGTWGVVGIVSGVLQETSYMRTDNEPADSQEKIDLAFGNVVLLTPGTITSFVPNPDHIHQTGNSFDENVISLHLYGHEMAGYHEYDREKGTKKWMDVDHN